MKTLNVGFRQKKPGAEVILVSKVVLNWYWNKRNYKKTYSEKNEFDLSNINVAGILNFIYADNNNKLIEFLKKDMNAMSEFRKY